MKDLKGLKIRKCWLCHLYHYWYEDDRMFGSSSDYANRCIRNHSGYDFFYVENDYVEVWYKPHYILLKCTDIKTQYYYYLKYSYSK